MLSENILPIEKWKTEKGSNVTQVYLILVGCEKVGVFLLNFWKLCSSGSFVFKLFKIETVILEKAEVFLQFEMDAELQLWKGIRITNHIDMKFLYAWL